MSYLNDIEDFTTDQLRIEIHRRETADRAGKCWYCSKNLSAHTCKLSGGSPVPGWEIKPAHHFYSKDGGCMAQGEDYWMTDARNPVTGKVVLGQGCTAAESTEKCIANINKEIS